jgi:hypothetical protein
MTAKKRTDEELLAAIERTADDPELAEIAAMPGAELDAAIRADGGDPDAIGERGARFAQEMLARRKRLRWQEAARTELEAMQAKVAGMPRTPALPRAELIARLKAAQSDARFREPIAAAFRKRSAEESTEEELRLLLDDIEMLRRLEES